MNHILFALNGARLNKTAVDFACYLAKISQSGLCGDFLENLVEDEKPVIINRYDGTYIEKKVDETSPSFQKKRNAIEQNIERFRELCCDWRVHCTIYENKKEPLTEISMETRYADLLILDPETSFRETEGRSPTDFVIRVLEETECPVVITPSRCDSIDDLVFAYDGSQSAVFAIKQFAYLFPEFMDRPVTILRVNEEGEKDQQDLPEKEKEKIGALLNKHFRNIEFRVLQGPPGKALSTYLLKKERTFVIMGAFGRGILSYLFKPSTGEKIMKTVGLPVFITHY